MIICDHCRVQTNDEHLYGDANLCDTCNCIIEQLMDTEQTISNLEKLFYSRKNLHKYD